MPYTKVDETTAKKTVPQPAKEERLDIKSLKNEIAVLDEKILHYQNMKAVKVADLNEIIKLGVKEEVLEEKAEEVQTEPINIK